MSTHEIKVWDIVATAEVPACAGETLTRASVYREPNTLYYMLFPSLEDLVTLEKAGLFQSWEIKKAKKGEKKIITAFAHGEEYK